MTSISADLQKNASGGELVVRCLLAQRVERVYCVPGESYLPVIDALFDVQDRISQITCRHESGAAMMAIAEAELTQRPSVCFVT
ncbi:MAG: thiamine pyrophosphate-binding protein, partial [Pseudomonadota bacterium]